MHWSCGLTHWVFAHLLGDMSQCMKTFQILFSFWVASLDALECFPVIRHEEALLWAAQSTVAVAAVVVGLRPQARHCSAWGFVSSTWELQTAGVGKGGYKNGTV
jgi:hypothetical protein